MTIYAIQPSDVATVDRERSRARKAALGSFVGAVVDWYDFLLYGIIAAIVFNTEFFLESQPCNGHCLQRSGPSAWASCFARWVVLCSVTTATVLAANACLC